MVIPRPMSSLKLTGSCQMMVGGVERVGSGVTPRILITGLGDDEVSPPQPGNQKLTEDS